MKSYELAYVDLRPLEVRSDMIFIGQKVKGSILIKLDPPRFDPRLGRLASPIIGTFYFSLFLHEIIIIKFSWRNIDIQKMKSKKFNVTIKRCVHVKSLLPRYPNSIG